MEQKKFFTLGRVILGILLVALFWFLIRIVFPVGSDVVEIETTRNELSHAGTGSFLDIEAPAKLGKNIHVNFVDMPEPGFVVIYRPDQYTNNGQEPQKFFGSTALLPKGTKENFDITLLEEAKCTNLLARLYRDLNGDGRFDMSVEGDGAPTNMNGESWVANPNQNTLPPTTVVQSFDVKCR